MSYLWADGSIGEGRSKSIYLEPEKDDVAVLIAFFNPVPFKRPFKNIMYIRHILREKNIPCYIAECVFFDRKPEIPDADLHVRSDSLLFYKEGLMNKLEKVVPEKYTKLVFLDGDIMFDAPDWVDQISAKLESTDIIQPFHYACWLYPDNTRVRVKKESYGYCIGSGMPYADPDKYHPGFCWAMRRDVFRKIGGFFDKAIVGKGDMMFLLALAKNVPPGKFEENVSSQIIRSVWPPYEAHVKAVNPSVGYLEGSVYHLFHGLRKNRQYSTRYDVLKDIESKPWDEIIHMNKDGLYELNDSKFNHGLLAYFKGREEDVPLEIAMRPARGVNSGRERTTPAAPPLPLGPIMNGGGICAGGACEL